MNANQLYNSIYRVLTLAVPERAKHPKEFDDEDYLRGAVALISALPQPGTEQPADQALLFVEVVSGQFESWCYEQDENGETLMSLSKLGLDPLGGLIAGWKIAQESTHSRK